MIEGCVATANVSGGTHIGGILGHGTTSDIAISGCVFSGTMTGGGEAKGALFGWGDNGGAKSVTDCLYVMADGQNTTNLDLVRQWNGSVSVTNCYKTTSAGSYGTQCIFTNSAPSQLGSLVKDYILVEVYEKALFCDGKYYLSPTTSTNAGTEGDPYIIADEADWVSFATWIDEHRDGFTGEYVQLAADITVSMPAGTSEAPFGGTFLGNGHTITATITDTSNDGTALFRYINGATIRDLTVAGTINGGMHAAAIVGFSQGTGNSIRNCVATANVSGGTHIGGILGHGLGSAIAISGCVFSGKMTGGGTAKGAIFGWGDNGGTKSVTDCLYVLADGQNTNGLDLVRLSGGTVSVANSYKTTNAGSNGTQCFPAAVEPANLGDLVQDYGKLRAYQNGILYHGTYYMVPASISLADNADNSTAINTADGFLANVTLSGRTLYKDGNWNTLCLPFNVTDGDETDEFTFSGTPLVGATVMELDGTTSGFDASTGTLTLNFNTANSISAGKPYIIKWAEGTDIANPVFYGVTIDNSDEALARKTVTSTDSKVSFRGIYDPAMIYSADHDNLFLGIGKNAQNEDVSMLFWPNTTDYTLGAFRAYFHVDLTETNGVRDIVLNFDEQGTQTVIGHTEITEITEKADAWYTVNGVKLEKEPTKKGMYIHGNRKVVINN